MVVAPCTGSQNHNEESHGEPRWGTMGQLRLQLSVGPAGWFFRLGSSLGWEARGVEVSFS